ncbi:enhanced serine sensitivity protein SseB [Streptomyces albidoflavus]|uniref:enhanced serine sensitivity protein SseB n=1 Tax=Streptomyces albidoflavus TaxID=1886 RepID=UPI00101E5BD5|nr:enhanced serine sensitivity protein SseB [Streptomyces albidoflavus]RZD65946.1 enhanced serine sensitivity protein SseB [Streptomyces albidoflavus]
MSIPAQAPHGLYGGWPSNELEEALAASLGAEAAGGRLVEVLGRSSVWVPLPNGGGPESGSLDLPTLDIDGGAYVPVFSSEQQFRSCVGGHLAFAVAPATEFARGLPPQLGIAVNPGGTVGVPLPPPAVAELCRTGRSPLDGPATGGRVRTYEPDWQEDPVDFLGVAAGEFEESGVVATARRCLASVEGGDPVLFVGVELNRHDDDAAQRAMDALGRALGRTPVPWPVNLVLLDATDDLVARWMANKLRTFYRREPS